MPDKDPEPDLPSTLERSSTKAQDTYLDTLSSAEDTYDGDEARSHRTAWASVKHNFEMVHHWEAKEEEGPSDAQAEQHGSQARDHPKPTAGGVDANASKEHLLDVARRLDVTGRSSMTKAELVDAIDAANRRATADARCHRPADS